MKFRKPIPRDGFFRAAAALTTGSALAQLLPMLASPLLARLYTPGELGAYALFVSTLNLTGQLACLKYDLALIVAPGEGQASGLLRLSLSLCAGVSLIHILPLGLFARPIAAYFSASSYKWVWLIAPATFAVGVHAAFVGANLKLQNTGAICRANVTRGVALALGQPILSSWGAEGLCLGPVSYTHLQGVPVKRVPLHRPLWPATPLSQGMPVLPRPTSRLPAWRNPIL